MSKYYFVEFSDQSSNIVPEEWMVGTNSCMWPIEKGADVNDLAKKRVFPKNSWKKYVCVVKQKSRSYQKLCQKMYTVEDISTTETSENDGTTPSTNAIIRSRSLTCNQMPSPDVSLNVSECSDGGALLAVQELQQDVRFIKKDVQSIKNTVGELKALIKEYSATAANQTYEQVLPGPAATIEELNKFLENCTSRFGLAKLIEFATLRSTIREFIKRTMSKKLALTFSYSGLGEKRAKIKHSFKEHGIYQFLIEVLQFTAFKDAKHVEVAASIKKVFNGVGDWEGGRAARASHSPQCIPVVQDNPQAPSETDSEDTDDTVPVSTDSGYGSLDLPNFY